MVLYRAQLLFVGSLFLLAGLYLVYRGFGTWQQKRLIQDTPTETVRGAALGRTELQGTGEPVGDCVTRPFGETDCVVAYYEIEELQVDRAPESYRWKTVDSGVVGGPFGLDDGTGTARIDPDGDTSFDISDEHSRQFRTKDRVPPKVEEFVDGSLPSSFLGALHQHTRRFTEAWIPPGETVYVLGAAEEAPETAESDLVVRRDGGSDEFILADRAETGLVEQKTWAAPKRMAVGLVASVFGLCLLLLLGWSLQLY